MCYSDGMTEPDPFPNTDRVIFIVRLWWETDGEAAEAGGEWRGSVEFLSSGQRVFFRRLADIDEIIAAQLKDLRPWLSPQDTAE